MLDSRHMLPNAVEGQAIRGTACVLIRVVFVLLLLIGFVPQSSFANELDAARQIRLAQFFELKYPKTPQELRAERKKRLKARKQRKKKVRAKSKARKPGQAKPSCKFPWSTSEDGKSCACAREGYALKEGKCVTVAQSCPSRANWSKTKGKCVCIAGYRFVDGVCKHSAPREKENRITVPERRSLCLPPRIFSADTGLCTCPKGAVEVSGRCAGGETTGSIHSVGRKLGAGPLLAPVYDVRIIQKCMVKAGYFDGKVDGLLGTQTNRAFRKFRAENGLVNRPLDLYDLESQRILFSLCPEPGVGEKTAPINVAVRADSSVSRGGAGEAGEDTTSADTTDRENGAGNKGGAVLSTTDAKAVMRVPGSDARPRQQTNTANNETVLIRKRPDEKTIRSGLSEPETQRLARNLDRAGSRGQNAGLEKDGNPDPFNQNDTAPSQALAKQSVEGRRPVTNTARRTNPRRGPSCLPQDLLDVLRQSRGRVLGLKRCVETCLPVPPAMSAAELRHYTHRYDVAWCKRCLRLTSYMPLKDILRIENQAKVSVCTAPADRLLFSREELHLIGKSFPHVRALYREHVPSIGNQRNIAVIVGNRGYQGRVPVFENGHHDAGAMYSLLIEHLGYTPEHIIDVRDASMAALEEVFGTEEDPKGELWRLVNARPGARVMVYFAGHGATNEAATESYLLPVDAVIGPDGVFGYPLTRLYTNLASLKAETMMVFLEATFGHDLSDILLPPNVAESKVDIAPRIPAPGLAVLAAATGNQKALQDPEYGIGLFTRYLIEGMAGQADTPPIGSGDRTIDIVELYVYTAHMVRQAARKSFGVLQHPSLAKKKNLFLSRLQENWR